MTAIDRISTVVAVNMLFIIGDQHHAQHHEYDGDAFVADWPTTSYNRSTPLEKSHSSSSRMCAGVCERTANLVTH